MKILITGAGGFIGKNLIAGLMSQRNKDYIIYQYENETPKEKLDEFIKDCDFVVHLASVYRPDNDEENNNIDFQLVLDLLERLKKYDNKCPILFSSVTGTMQDTKFVQNKRNAETELLKHAQITNTKVFIYRLNDIFGKWARPNGHSVVATLCYNIARDMDINISDRNHSLNLCHIDDVIDFFILAINGYAVSDTDGFYRLWDDFEYRITLGRIVDLLSAFHRSRDNLNIPDLPDEFTKKLYSTYLTYLPKNEFNYKLPINKDVRGSSADIYKTEDRGRLSVKSLKPGIKTGEHWHRIKSERIIVLNGMALFQLRKIDEEEIINYLLTSESMEVIEIPAGYAHNIINIGNAELILLIWVNEVNDINKTDTFLP